MVCLYRGNPSIHHQTHSTTPPTESHHTSCRKSARIMPPSTEHRVPTTGLLCSASAFQMTNKDRPVKNTPDTKRNNRLRKTNLRHFIAMAIAQALRRWIDAAGGSAAMPCLVLRTPYSTSTRLLTHTLRIMIIPVWSTVLYGGVCSS